MYVRVAMCHTKLCFLRFPVQTVLLHAGTSSSQDRSLSRSTCTWHDAGKKQFMKPQKKIKSPIMLREVEFFFLLWCIRPKYQDILVKKDEAKSKPFKDLYQSCIRENLMS